MPRSSSIQAIGDSVLARIGLVLVSSSFAALPCPMPKTESMLICSGSLSDPNRLKIDGVDDDKEKGVVSHADC
jgi:hypothetical protein